MITLKPKAKFRVGQTVEHKVRYFVKGVEKYKWERVKILEKSLCQPKEGTYWWTYRFENPLMGFFRCFEGEEQFRAVQR